jgi:hypothetical protein
MIEVNFRVVFALPVISGSIASEARVEKGREEGEVEGRHTNIAGRVSESWIEPDDTSLPSNRNKATKACISDPVTR